MEVIEKLIQNNRELEKQIEINYSQTAPICYGDLMDILATALAALRVVEAAKAHQIAGIERTKSGMWLVESLQPFQQTGEDKE